MSQIKWEYMSEAGDVARMDVLGKDGWEAFSAVPVFGRTDDSMLRILYKRPKGDNKSCPTVKVEVTCGS
jgi:hypothetical protein